MTLPYRILALDLDGTLLTTNKTVSPRTLASIRRVEAMGARVVIVTGRNLPKACESARLLGVPTTVIAHNGAVTADGDTESVMDAAFIPSETAHRLCAEFRARDCEPFLYVRDGDEFRLTYESNERNPARDRYLAANASVSRRVAQVEDGIDAVEIVHIVAIEPMSRVKSTLDELTGVHSSPNGATVMTSGGLYDGSHWFLEAVPTTASKLIAISSLCDDWNISLNKVIAVGDNYNDAELLAAVGLGVAMGNAPDEIKRISRRTVGTNDEDGIADLLSDTFFNS
ncbi:MAG: Cof-type HAD-IIB family hydrolase [Candidatus Poribacteria bacterium]|nr:Cof-type HAD-IIB family hydrolase [Candidatus Poribacteria bacterium]